ncbi:MAG: carbon-nitrogen hydrolase family protein [Phycisphaerales bacterium]|nr:MAG: carbon-nitrogen hydrolase family protein [Phycisphaerales bacterium]
MKTIGIAICQIFLLDGDRSGNFVRIENAIRQTKDAGADIVCFPEMVVLGWVNPAAHERSQPIPGKDSDRLCELAVKYGTYLCAGLAEKAGANLHDSALLISNRGEILLKHRKINLLTELMTPPYTAGNEVCVAETEFGRIGLLICADTHEDGILDRMAGLGPDLVLVPYGYAAAEEDWPGHGRVLERVVANAARKTGAPVVGTNLVGEITSGPWKGRVYGGHSVVADKNGKTVAVAADRDRDIQVIPVRVGR